ncbi:heavy metal-associated domain-containing protein [Flavobacteriaceae bacterium S356]|uniref:Heavy metal-associated domain-containing protein n=1 Tax=Asprobacillus argus TaxID=3076534 RepID=A0ABU3LG89_9FLAO|nr:heavy metal-associated domain-containing protein [Flavobacteriaceae bacterium S356]
MKFSKVVLVLALSIFSLSSCKQAAKKEVEAPKKVLAQNPQSVSLSISGMTCEIGCAKLIQSKLSKKEGVKMAKVIFKDSTATVAFDANTISKKEIIGFIDGIADGELYKATELTAEK